MTRTTLHALLLAGLVCLAYANTLHSPFILDDDITILHNRGIRIKEFTRTTIPEIFHNSHAGKRLVANISFALNYLYGGDDPYGYHLVNILIHIMSAIGTMLLFKLFLEEHTDYGPYSHIPFLIAAIWAVHPVQTSAVTYITQRMTAMSGMITIYGLYIYMRGRKMDGWKRVTAMLLFICLLLLALGSKETTLLTLPMLVLYEYLFYARGDWKKLQRLCLATILMLFGACMLLYVYFGFQNPLPDLLIHITSYATAGEDYTLRTRCLTEFRVFVYYISLLFFPAPARQMLIYSYPPSSSLLDPATTLLSMAAIIITIAAAFRVRQKQYTFLVLWYFIYLALESGIFKLHLVFEHRLYLPSIGIIAAFVIFSSGITRRFRREKLLMPAGCLLIVILTLLTYNRNGLWKNTITLYEDNLKKNRSSHIVYNNLAAGYQAAGMYKKAELAQLEAIKMAPSPMYYSNLGGIYNDLERYDDAIKAFDTALKVLPTQAIALMKKGIAMFAMGEPGKAVALYKKSIASDPLNFSTYYNMSGAYMALQDWKNTIETLKTASRIKPDDYKVYLNKGVAHINRKEFATAVDELKKAERLNKNDYAVFMNAGIAYWNLGRADEAVKQFGRADEIAGSNTAPAYYLALVMYQEKKYIKAEAWFKKSANSVEFEKSANRHLCVIYMKLKEYRKGIRLIGKVSSEYGLNWRLANYSGFEIQGSILIGLERFRQAEAAFQNALAADNNSSEALFQTGMLNMLHLNNPKKGRFFLTAYLNAAGTEGAYAKRAIRLLNIGAGHTNPSWRPAPNSGRAP